MNARALSRSEGLTLVEVLVAVMVLTIGIIALVQLQAASLRNTATAEAINRTTRLVRGELEWQRQTALEPDELECSALVPEDFEGCVVVVEPCALVFLESGGGDFVCGAGVSPSSYRVTVTAEGPRGQELELRTIWTGVFIAGAAGSADE